MEPGSRFAHYIILSAIGKGGMGEVWKAQDTKLGREVAIKSLPEGFAQETDRLARFEREARTLAALNHPNIAAIYGLEKSAGATALVMELVEGPTLADRLAKGPMPLEEALAAARQIAEGLEAAHEQNIVHRDLKPANIKLRPDGAVKLLDFGLAKSIEAACDAATVAQPSTSMPTAMTQPGLVVGTAAYMSPEQAGGKPVDRRTDIWAFGCVLYEMLTGKRTFRGEALTDTLAAVITTEPDWSELPAATPQPVRSLLRRCLQKNLRQRLQAIGDARIALEDFASGIASSTGPSGLGSGSDEALSSASAAKRRARIAWIMAGVAMFAAVVLATSLYVVSQRSVAAQPLRLSMTLPEDWSLALSSSGLVPTSVVLSPNGRQVAILARRRDGPFTILMRDLDSASARPLAGTENATSLFWSPDSQFIGFFVDGKLKKVAVSGGEPKVVCDVTPPFGGGTWSRDGTIVFSMLEKRNFKLWKVADGGGQPTRALPDAPASEGANGGEAGPWFLPDGRTLLYTTSQNNTLMIYAARLDSPDRARVVATGSRNVEYAEGRLLYLQGTTLVAQSFDEKRLVVMGSPIPVADRVLRQGVIPGYGVFSASLNGILVHESNAAVETQLAWVDRQGHALEKIGERKDYRGIALSHNEDRVAALVGSSADLWIINRSNNVSTQLTFDPEKVSFPVWSPDDEFIDFAVPTIKGQFSVSRKPSNGSGASVPVFPDGPKLPFDRSRDGSLLYMSPLADETGPDLWVLPGSGDRTPFRLAATPENKRLSKFSPDGRWVAYVSYDSSGENVWVVPAIGRTDTSGARWKISGADGGTLPLWSSDGRELFYLSSSKMLTAVQVNGDAQAFQKGPSTALFPITVPQLEGAYSGWLYAVSRSGRFLVIRSSQAGSDAVAEPVSIEVNWAAGLAR